MEPKHPGSDAAEAGRFEEAASLLLSFVALSAKIDDWSDPTSCALGRIPRVGDAHGSLSSRAIALGFTEKEAWGIMSGWDSKEQGVEVRWGSERYPGWISDPEYLHGVRLGEMAWEVKP